MIVIRRRLNSMALFGVWSLVVRRVPSVWAFATPSSFRPTSLAASTSSSSRLCSSLQKSETDNDLIPMTLLAGFLGSGKTSALKHLLENTQGVKIGVIVNDVAEVNIDAKLVSSNQKGVVELQNGCACCSLADELLTSVETLLKPSENEERPFDALVVELSGVADPVAVVSNWKAYKAQQHPVTYQTDISNIVTVVDASTFGSDWMTWDAAGDRQGWVDEADECGGQTKVPELLAEQVEAANVILMNKIDLASDDQVKVASSVARGINEKATLQTVEFGRVSPQQVLGKSRLFLKEEEETTAHDHSHDHAAACEEPDCTDPSHEHSHSHKHDETTAACTDPDCTDETHSHSHSHDNEAAACDDPDCTDETHSHSHSHSHSTSTDKLGIVNFVYKASRPFQTQRLMALLNQWPVPIKEDLDLELLEEAQSGGYDIQGETQQGSPFVGVLRSKGFAWLAPTKWRSTGQNDVWRHSTAMYWSHAGKHFGITTAGKWWGTIPKERMKDYFVGNEAEYERIIKDDFVSDEWGDRRQEIVFIGMNINEEEIRKALDDCLCTDKEMETYRQKLQNFEASMFSAQASLFNLGGTDHMN